MKKTGMFLFFWIFLAIGCAMVPEIVKQGDTYYLQKDYIQALNAYEAGLPNVKDAAARRGIEEKLTVIKKILVNQSLMEAERALAGANPPNMATLSAAIQILKKAPTDDAAGSIAAKRSAYHTNRQRLSGDVERLTRETEAAIRQFSFNDASDLVDKAKAIDPENVRLTEMKGAIASKSQLYAAIQKDIENGDINNALTEFTQMVGAVPTKNDVHAFPLKDRCEELIRKQLLAYASDNRWQDALALLDKWPSETLELDRQEIRSKGSDFYLNAAKVAASAENDSHKGFIFALQAMKLNDSNPELFNTHKLTQDVVNQSLQRHIAVASFDSPSDDPDAGKQFSDSLISYLFQVLPYGINILERDKMDYLLKERGSGEAKSIGELLGVDLMVTGTVSLYRVEETIDKRMATVKVKTGTDIVENLEYTQMLQLLGPDTAKWPKIPPRTIEKEIFQMLSYNKGTAQKKGFAKVSVRIFDTHKGKITYVKDFDASIVKSTDFQDELKEANIPYIAMSLPTDTEIKEEMRQSIVTQVAKVVQSSFEDRQLRYLNQAQFHLDRKEFNAALKPLAEGYLYCVQDNIPKENEPFTKIREMIAALIRRPDVLPRIQEPETGSAVESPDEIIIGEEPEEKEPAPELKTATETQKTPTQEGAQKSEGAKKK